MLQDKFILHWLDNSRSQRIVWLFELLHLNYELKVYLRSTKTLRAPSSLKEIHPSGKLPVVEIYPADGSEKKVLAESGLIVQYIITNYDKDKILTPSSESDKILADYYLHYSEGTIQPLLVALLVNSVAKTQAPFGFKTLVGTITHQINLGYFLTELLLNLDNLENELKKKGTGYFAGDKLTGADVILSFPLWENIFKNPDRVSVAGVKDDPRKRWPTIARWADEKVGSDPLYKKVTLETEEKVKEARASSHL